MNFVLFDLGEVRRGKRGVGHWDSAGGQVQPLPQLTCGSIIPRMRLLMGENNSKSDQTTPVMAPPGRKLPPSAPACCRWKRLGNRNNAGDQTRLFSREDEDGVEIWDAENENRGSAAVIGRERRNIQEVDICSWRSRKPQPGSKKRSTSGPGRRGNGGVEAAPPLPPPPPPLGKRSASGGRRGRLSSSLHLSAPGGPPAGADQGLPQLPSTSKPPDQRMGGWR